MGFRNLLSRATAQPYPAARSAHPTLSANMSGIEWVSNRRLTNTFLFSECVRQFSQAEREFKSQYKFRVSAVLSKIETYLAI
jgi:hypothetical protein